MKIKLTFLLILFYLSSDAQWFTFDIIPNQIQVNEEVKLICQADFPSQPTGIDSFSKSSSNNLIIIDVFYFQGDAASPSSLIDTFNLGGFEEGFYQIIYNHIVNAVSDSIIGSDTILFTVGNPKNINDNSYPELSIYPNPFTSTFVISNENGRKGVEKRNLPSIESINIQLYNLIGDKVDFSFLEMTDSEIIIYTLDLPKDIYILEIDGFGIRKIIKQ